MFLSQCDLSLNTFLKAAPPEPWDALGGLERLVLLRCLRLDKVSLAVRRYKEKILFKE